MGATFVQAGKPIRVLTPLAEDTLLLEAFSAHERVSEPFEITLDLLSTNPKVDPDALLRKAMVIAVELPDGSGERFFHGLVRRFTQGGRGDTYVMYRAEVVPALWFLDLATDCRVFQQQSVPDIVQTILREQGVTDVRATLSGSYPKRDYCVQYRESHFAFISRLLEEEGIFYFFEHAKDKHTLVLADAPSAVKPGAVSSLPVSAATVDDDTAPDSIETFTIESLVHSGKVTLSDYNDTVPKRLESASTSAPAKASSKNLSRYDYPGKFDASAGGERLARIRLEAHEAVAQIAVGTTNCRALSAGQKLDVTEHYRSDLNQSYHLLAVQNVGRVNYAMSENGDDDTAFQYSAQFSAIPYAVQYRPPLRTPRSVVYGTQTALVVGPSGEEIHVDKYGRVKVQFFWDYRGANDDKSSCWVRVSSAWAGKGWGAIQIPRIGQEVVVDFLEGDPDRPIIVGRVYNADQMPPYALPGNGTQSGIKSRSSKGGGPDNANELRFEDKKGSEQVYFHAEKDLDSRVLNDETRMVDHDRTTVIKNDELLNVTEGNHTIAIDKGDQKITVSEGDQVIAVSQGDQTVTVDQGKQTITVHGDRSVTVQTGNDKLTLQQGDWQTKVQMGNSTHEVSMGDLSTQVKMGNATLKTSLGAINFEGMQGIELKVGANSIKIDQTGVTIKGIMVKIEGTAMTDIKAPMTQLKGDAMLKAQGGITMIN